jgi:predicted methyltransferase
MSYLLMFIARRVYAVAVIAKQCETRVFNYYSNKKAQRQTRAWREAAVLHKHRSNAYIEMLEASIEKQRNA